VNQHDGNHEVRSPAVHRAEEPAKCQLVIQNVQAIPCLSGGGHVDQRKQDTRHNLKHEQDKGGTPKDIPPTGCLIGDGVESHLFDGLAELQTVIKPGVQSLQPAHGDPP
jgi:hypothetical protein